MSQEERSVFWEVIISAILSKKKKCIYTCVLFRTASETELFYSTVPELLIRKRYYVLFLIPVFIVQVTELVLQLVWGHGVLLACTVYSVQWDSSTSETVRNRTHIHIHLFRMTDTMTSQNINLSSSDTLYNPKFRQADVSVCHLLLRWFIVRLILRAWRWRKHITPKHRLTFNGLNGAISQKR
jgi:hypothetical protein